MPTSKRPRRKPIASPPRKAAKTELTPDALAKLGVKRLAVLLYEASEDDATLARRLRTELLADDPVTLAKEIDRQIASLGRAQSFVDWRRAGDLMKSLDAVRASIAGALANRDPAAAIERLSAFFALAGPTIERCDDSNGRIASVFQNACVDYAATVTRVESAITQFECARKAFQLADADGYGVLDHLVDEVIKRLPAEPLAKFRTLVEADLKRDAKDAGIHSSRWRRTSALRAIADAQGDVDLFVAAEMAKSPHTRDAAGMAQRLVAAGRPPEALQILDAAESNPAEDVWRLEDARIDALEALGRTDEAQAARWSAFQRGLRADPLRAYLKRLPDFEDEAKEREALAFVGAHRDVSSALAFLIAWPAIRAAGAFVRRRRTELGGDHYWTFTPAAELLSEKEPLAATLLLRAMVDFTLDGARSTRYGHAARHLSDCARIARRIHDWEGAPDHTACLANLCAKHPRKVGFWSIVNGKNEHRVPEFGLISKPDE